MPVLRKSSDGFTRNDVVQAFQNAFDMIGGTTRLALWANAHPDKFYPLYAKLLPATTINLGDSTKIEIIHRIAPTALDQHEVVECHASNLPMSHDGTSMTSIDETSDGQSLSPTDVQVKP